MADFYYLKAATALGRAQLDCESNLYAILLDNGHTSNQATHEFASSVIGDELATGGGYTIGGNALTGLGASEDTGLLEVHFQANDTTWTNSSITARYCIVVIAAGSATGGRPWDPALSRVVRFVDFLEDKTTSSEPFTIKFGDSAPIIIDV